MLALIGTAFALMVAQPTGQKLKADESHRAKLIGKGKGHFIHAISSVPKTEYPPDEFAPDSLGVSVVHTSTATGDMKVLAAYSKNTTRRPLRSGDRFNHHQVAVAGIIADKERLYVLKRTSKWTT